jgi:acyl transferase domain-containing protein/acyl carrier protein
VSTSSEQLVEALRTSLKETERLERENRRLLAASSEPLAIVGIGCRYPGGVRSAQELWELLANATDAIGPFPANRGWDLERLYDPQPDSPRRSYVREGGFLDDAGDFDAPFFQISPREALGMDPQHRLLLETSWEAIEDAGIDPLALQGSDTGVFVGSMHHDYGGDPANVPEALEGYLGAGSLASVASGLLSYSLGLEGPALSVDTACSSSLVALHLGCRALRQRECSLALAGGASVMATPGVFVQSSRQRTLAADGRCKSYADSADGTGLSEGVGVVVLERLSDAVRLGHGVLGVVRGSAVNQDGASNGFTAPSGPSQQRVIRAALLDAGVSASGVDVVEGHGTGTRLGDPIEAQALLAVYGRSRRAGRPLWLGSLKSNIGHTQAAAGVGGVIKMVMALRHGVLPRTLHVDRPSGEVDWSVGDVSLLVDEVVWDGGGELRRAGVSSFGASGTNAHVILEEAPVVSGGGRGVVFVSGDGDRVEGVEGESVEGGDRVESVEGVGVLGGGVLPLVLSARGGDALAGQARRLFEFLSARPGLDLVDVGCSLCARSVFEDRAVVVGGGRDELLGGLGALAEGRSAGNVVCGGVGGGVGGVVFVFPGQGSQWVGMAGELLDCSSVFARRVGECERALAPHIDWSLEDVLRGVDGAASLERIDVVQPALFVMMVALAAVWEACGVRPGAVVGHSQGEIAAAHIAGALSLQDAARMVVVRSRTFRELSDVGAMMSVALSSGELEERLEQWEQKGISLGAVNGPSSVVVSGDFEALGELRERCEAEGIRAREVPATVSSHSHHVEGLRERLLDALSSVLPKSATVPFYSTVTSEPVNGALLDTHYWYRNVREQVRFEPTIRRLLDDGFRTFVEVSPHPVLSVAVEETIDARPGGGERARVVGTLRRGEGGPRRLQTSLAQAWSANAPVDWRLLYEGSGARRISLPPYAFQRRRYWLQPASSSVETQALAPVMPEQASGALAKRLAGASGEERKDRALDFVRDEVAVVLGHPSGLEIDADRAFKDLGFDSLLAVELRNRMVAATGLELAATLVFDHPTPTLLAEALLSEIDGTKTEDALAVSVSSATEEPIAIVGMSCRYPGGVRSPQELWELVASGTDVVGAFPTDRGWDLEKLFDTESGDFGTSYAREGGFIYDIGDFDAAFFGISPREALAMDPQQRLMLEASWEALESAGIDPGTLHGSQTGVFVGAGNSPYGSSVEAGATGVESFRFTGVMGSIASGRIAYTLGLDGPAVSIDTACSSSLVALHLACGALRSGECGLALAGGASVMLTPDQFIEFSRQQGLAPDGRCKSFSAAADGTGWGEGAGMLLLERLSDARKLGHPVLALVSGSAVNQDGASNGLTAPSGPAQQRVIRRALASAGLSVSDVDAVEAHGTGTRLGDPIEARALLKTYGQERDRPLWLGSIKSNIGHTGLAAGVAGVIKMVMAMRHEVLPRTLHVDAPSADVDWSAGAISLLSEQELWPREGRPRRAGISSFGLSGTNAHVIVEEAPAQDVCGAKVESAPSGEATPWIVSARDSRGLRASAERLHDFAMAHDELDPSAIGSALARRPELAERAVVIGLGRDQLLGGLASMANGEVAPELLQGTASAAGGRLAFLFTGQGAQRVGMGHELYRDLPVFRDSLEEVCSELDAHLGRSLLELMFAREDSPEVELLTDTMFAQASLFAFEVSMLRLLEAWGVRPDYLIGHSIGELAAAFAAGVFSLPDACKLVAARGRLMSALPAGGAMFAVQADHGEADESLAGYEGRVTLAAVNGPSSVVLSGEQDAVEELAELWSQRGRKVKRLRVSHAFHSHRMDGMLESFAEAAREIHYAPPRIPVVSNLLGEQSAEALCSPEYWVRHVRETVRFADGVNWLCAHGVAGFLEIGPDGSLSSMVGECLGDREHSAEGGQERTVVAALKPGRPERHSLVTGLAELWTRGASVDWGALIGKRNAGGVQLPSYPFQRERYWLDSLATLQRGAGRVSGSDSRPAQAGESGFWDAVSREDLDGLLETLQVEDEGQRASLDALLPSLSAWRHRSREQSRMNDWRYRVGWKPVTPGSTARLSGSWLVLMAASQSEEPWVEVLTDALRERGASVSAVGCERESDSRLAMTGLLRDALERLPREGKLQGVLSLLGLQEGHHEVNSNVRNGLIDTVTLTQALGDAEVQAPLWLLTRGAVCAEPADSAPDPAQAQLWGFGMVAGLEYPQRWGGIVDLPERVEPRVGSLLAASLVGGAGEDQLAIRGAGIRVRRVERAPHAPGSDVWKPAAGTVLITGGTGGLGAHVARWLARLGAEHLLLVSRSGAEAEGAADLYEELADLGAAVTIAACDVSDREQLQALIDSVPQRHPLSMVMHAAGLPTVGTIDSMSPKELEQGLAAKAQGALHLHELTEGLDLTAFVMFSSIAATFGSAHQATYAAANAYLDALAGHRRARALPATSVAWGPWAGAGMSSHQEGVVEVLRRRGLECMEPRLAVEALQQALLADESSLAVADVRWDTYAPLFTSARARPLIEDLPEVRSVLDAGTQLDGAAAGSELRARLREASARERRQLLLELVRSEVARVMGHSTLQTVDPKRAFRELGFDSLMAVELNNRLTTATGLKLPPTLVFDYPTPNAVVEHLTVELTNDGVPAGASLDRELAGLERALASLEDGEERKRAMERLNTILAGMDGGDGRSAPGLEQDGGGIVERMQTASDDELFTFIDQELQSR